MYSTTIAVQLSRLPRARAALTIAAGSAAASVDLAHEPLQLLLIQHAVDAVGRQQQPLAA